MPTEFVLLGQILGCPKTPKMKRGAPVGSEWKAFVDAIGYYKISLSHSLLLDWLLYEQCLSTLHTPHRG